jgi:hypothetical protein
LPSVLFIKVQDFVFQTLCLDISSLPIDNETK